jgi:hypothetical protein
MDRVLGSHYKVRVRVSTSSNDNAVQNSGQNYDIKNLVERAKSFGVPNATIE